MAVNSDPRLLYSSRGPSTKCTSSRGGDVSSPPLSPPASRSQVAQSSLRPNRQAAGKLLGLKYTVRQLRSRVSTMLLTLAVVADSTSDRDPGSMSSQKLDAPPLSRTTASPRTAAGGGCLLLG
ncbi:hypothetical protein OH76DRAFT_863773 [Lentinus brumalis]|uniref:Uncharacterized protein n=1 Tax=Lentinus brumalis TaxID=2498619 RepID=A0A371DRF0_9APHY|nr:hypothetical protein OH76DRAFT_863773 [Polyporus brumalis]